MSKQYKSFIEELKIQCPELPKDNLKDVTTDSGLSTLEDFTKAQFVNFEAKREDLYRLSMDIEAYAVKNYVPLLATFETEKLYKYVQKRYTDILKKIPHAWVIGGSKKCFIRTCAGAYWFWYDCRPPNSCISIYYSIWWICNTIGCRSSDTVFWNWKYC